MYQNKFSSNKDCYKTCYISYISLCNKWHEFISKQHCLRSSARVKSKWQLGHRGNSTRIDENHQIHHVLRLLKKHNHKQVKQDTKKQDQEYPWVLYGLKNLYIPKSQESLCFHGWRTKFCVKQKPFQRFIFFTKTTWPVPEGHSFFTRQTKRADRIWQIRVIIDPLPCS